jgi:hypothetical protein
LTVGGAHTHWQEASMEFALAEVVVIRVLGYQRAQAGGWALLLDVKMGDSPQQVCRLVFPSEEAMAGLRKFMAEASPVLTQVD